MKNKKLSITKYLERIKPHLPEIKNDLKKSGEQKKRPTMKLNFCYEQIKMKNAKCIIRVTTMLGLVLYRV